MSKRKWLAIGWLIGLLGAIAMQNIKLAAIVVAAAVGVPITIAAVVEVLGWIFEERRK